MTAPTAQPFPTRFAVVSESHHLLPLAHRLVTEGAEVSIFTRKQAFTECWKGWPGMDVKAAPSTTFPDRWGPVGESILSGETVLVTDSVKVTHTFEAAPAVLGRPGAGAAPAAGAPRPHVQVGCWWNEGVPSGFAWLAADHGLWPGGLGLPVVGALTRISAPRMPAGAAEAVAKAQVPSGYRGLVIAGLTLSAEGEWALVSTELGWPLLSTDMLVGSLPETTPEGVVEPLLSLILSGAMAPPAPLTTFTIALPVSSSPWPLYPHGASKRAERVVLPQLTGPAGPRLRSMFSFHDFAVEGGTPHLAGVDGLLGVLQVPGNTLVRCRHILTQVLAATGFVGMQARLDAGSAAERLLVQLDTLGLWPAL